MSDTIIKIENLGKSYFIGHEKQEKYTALRDVVVDNIKGFGQNINQIFQSKNRPIVTGNEIEEFWALKDLSCEIKRGESIGIIGRNGAGKSTLLKLLSRITEPTKGRIEINGRVASLLEVGTGFHPELTGRENIFLNGAILGMSRQEIKSKFDEIVNFSGVEKFLDTPVKRYSSGMYVRLAFSVAAHLEPDVLVVDEVLAVGDSEFQKKCLGKMSDVSKDGGRTVIFVSHNMAAIKSLCPKTIWLNQGILKNVGETYQVIEEYLISQSHDDNNASSSKSFTPDENKQFQTLSISILDSKRNPKSIFECDEDINIMLRCISREPIPNLYGWLDLTNTEGIMVIMSDTFDISPNCLDSLPKGEYLFNLKIPARTIGHGKYVITLAFTSPQSINNFYIEELKTICSFEIYDNSTKRGNNRPGFLSTLIKWEFEKCK